MAEALNLLTVPEAADLVHKTAAALYAAIHRGDLLCVDRFGRKLVSRHQLKKYQEATKIGRPKNGNKKAGK